MKIENVPTNVLNEIIQNHTESGWKKIYEYDAFDAWIDYGKVVLAKAGVRLIFKWDNWTEGQIEGPEDIVKPIDLQIRESKDGAKPV